MDSRHRLTRWTFSLPCPAYRQAGGRQGFSLIEVLVVISIIGLFIGFSESSLHLFLSQMNARDTTSTYVQTLHRAQLLAQSGRGDAPWGVMATTNRIVLYKGASYATRDSAYDEQYTSTGAFGVSGLTEVTFAKLSGKPNTLGTTTILVDTVPTTTVYINAKGTINY
ncbi:MAG: prepilin-type N-terminal cleavage/methylation domain-containing protein [bacterium]|nr:prepilin-type N-terminal cleavage/methylation domain-containing protein [bacterium]